MEFPWGMRAEAPSDIVGVGIALVLLVLLRALLPKAERGRARAAAIFFALALFFGSIMLLADDASRFKRIVSFFFYLFLLGSAGRSLVLLAVDVVVGRRTHRAPPKIFRDLTQAIVYLVALLLTLRLVGVEPGSLLTTSALLTAVIGLALQDTLGNLVSGLALQMQSPFEVGDWIQFDPDPKQVGQVTEVNWRATTLMTSDLVEVIVPNAMLAKAAIRNFSRPSRVSRRTVSFQAPYETPTRTVHETVLAALGNLPGVLSDPGPWVQTRTFDASGIEYVISFFTAEFASRDAVDGTVRDRIWYALQRAGIEMPFPIRTVHMHAVSDESRRRADLVELERRDAILRCVDFLGVLPETPHRALAAAASVRMYAPDEVIVAQGETSSELFIIDRGFVVVELAREGETMPIARLGPGKFFGEMALMTGEERKATVRAVGECELLVIGHEAFERALAAAPDVLEKMGELLLARQTELDQAAAAEPERLSQEIIEQRSQRLLQQIRGFFRI